MVNHGQTADTIYYVNGVNASTGAYIEYSQSAHDIARWAVAMQRPTAGQSMSSRVRDLHIRATRGAETWGAIPGIDEANLQQAGWAVIFAQDIDPHIKTALHELLTYRCEQSGNLYREYSGDQGYIAGETWEDFRRRHRVGTGLADPQEMPYYVLLVGEPHSIPYSFQFDLDVERAVGRIFFKTPDEYAWYAQSVLQTEKSKLQPSAKAIFFATSNPQDLATQLSSRTLVTPLVEALRNDPVLTWQIEHIQPQEAYKSKLRQIFSGEQTAQLFFSATHGAAFDMDDPRMLRHQGALITQDWPGPFSGIKRLSEVVHYFSADDVPEEAKLTGMIAMFFACFSAGTPSISDFIPQLHGESGEQLRLANTAFLAALPQRLLAHPNGGTAAVIGHVERCWTHSFITPDSNKPQAHQFAPIQRLLKAILLGYPVGLAMEELNSRYAQLSTELLQQLYRVTYQGEPLVEEVERQIADLWTAVNDARNYIIIGDPAVRLPVTPAGLIRQ